ncbi:hypothetical protein WH221_03170 [Chryseobacterium culicis]|uniref:Uncharacterized protein n=1 Tax=Chryseobacterium culicis TaxID=680127 RepID=A0A2S9CXT3_CHRCI|nr:hypothetical protein [Chryseobacterium culicis]PRB85270.1 hypothetical protein CQ022_03115 [Chryseobacterium culicis]PRB91010.1 hypothetical protein CQ033_09875 [Chryseobacterium culicis]
MYSISEKINITEKASVEKSNFINDEALPSAIITFSCGHCSHKNTVEIVPYESGFPLFQVYNENKVLSREELLKHGIVNKTSQRMLHFGELTVNDQPTLYFGTDCTSCHSKYICVFSFGEKQPGLMVLNISGVWKYE